MLRRDIATLYTTMNQLFGPNYSASASVNTTIRPNIWYSVNTCFGRSLVSMLEDSWYCGKARDHTRNSLEIASKDNFDCFNVDWILSEGGRGEGVTGGEGVAGVGSHLLNPNQVLHQF